MTELAVVEDAETWVGDYGAVPADLRERPQWVIWRIETRDSKPTKVPYRADGKGKARSTDPKTWCAFEDVVLAAEFTPNVDGIGYVFSADDPYVGIDLDAGLSESDRADIMARLNSYSETSPSGKAAHVLVAASMNGHPRNRGGGLEIYEKERFFTVTGRHISTTPATIEERQEQLDYVLQRYLPAPPTAETVNRPAVPVPLDDRDLIDRALAAKNGTDFQALLDGRWEGRYTSQSEADLAFCGMLAFWTGRDPDRIDRIFRSSGLYRDKWERVDYREGRISLASSGCADVYTPAAERHQPPKGGIVEPTGLKPAIGFLRTDVGNAETPSNDAIEWHLLSDVEMRSIVFLDKPLWQADAFHLLCGRKGQGKGTLLSLVAAGVTRGELGQHRNVVWIGSEDSAAIDIKPRIVAANGDPARVLVVKRGWIQLPRDIFEIERAMTELGEVGLLVIDPVGNHIVGKNSDADTDIRDAIAPLNQVADRHHCMVVGVRHLTEKEASKGVLAAILGSSAWVQIPRAVIAVARDSDDPQISHVQCVAGNRLPAGSPGRMLRIEGVLLDGLENEVTRATWIGDSTKDVETMLAHRAAKEPSKSATARELILDLLEAVDHIESDTLDARVADETGIAAKTVKNLRTRLKDEGLVRAWPEKDPNGTVLRWLCSRTLAPRNPHPDQAQTAA